MKRLVAKILVMAIGFSLILAFVLGWFLWDNSPATYYHRIFETHHSLMTLRSRIKTFKVAEGRYPHSLDESRRHTLARRQAEGLPEISTYEYISDPNGSNEESHILNGQGGWYYNYTTGEVKVNLDKPLSHYFRFISGADRTQVPSDW